MPDFPRARGVLKGYGDELLQHRVPPVLRGLRAYAGQPASDELVFGSCKVIEIILKEGKKARCCGKRFDSGEKIFFDRMTSKFVALIGVPYMGTYSLHKIKLNPKSYGLKELCAQES